MIYLVLVIIEYVFVVFIFLLGDVIMMGIFVGVGIFEVGDVVEVEIFGLGILCNMVCDVVFVI